MRGKRGGTAPSRAAKRTRTRSVQGPLAPSPWQAAVPELILSRIFERLLAMHDGNRWVRVASHVCSHWRSTAHEVLLADTAISKPPLEDFRSIGRQPAPQLAKPAKADTVTTQAAVVIEATASTGMEAISKQRFDAPPPVVVATAGGPPPRPRAARGAPHTARDVRDAREGTRGRQQQQLQQQRRREHEEEGEASQGAAPRAQGAPPPAAASPSRQPRQARPAAPQGSIQSELAMGHPPGAAGADSDSDGSTRAQAGAGAKRKRPRSRAGKQTASVDAPVRRQASEPGRRGASGQPSTARAAEPAGPSSGTRSRGKRAASSPAHGPQSAIRKQPAAQQQQPQAEQGRGSRGEHTPTPPVPAAATPARQRRGSNRSKPAAAVEPEGASGASGAYYEAEPGVEVEQAAAEAGPAAAAPQQREASGGPVHGLMVFVKRIVGL